MKFSLDPVPVSHKSPRISTNTTQDHAIPDQESPESSALPKLFYQCQSVFLEFLLFHSVEIDCLKFADIVNDLNAGAIYQTFYKTGQKFVGIFKMGNILEMNVLKMILVSWQKPTFL